MIDDGFDRPHHRGGARGRRRPRRQADQQQGARGIPGGARRCAEARRRRDRQHRRRQPVPRRGQSPPPTGTDPRFYEADMVVGDRQLNPRALLTTQARPAEARSSVGRWASAPTSQTRRLDSAPTTARRMPSSRSCRTSRTRLREPDPGRKDAGRCRPRPRAHEPDRPPVEAVRLDVELRAAQRGHDLSGVCDVRAAAGCSRPRRSCAIAALAA